MVVQDRAFVARSATVDPKVQVAGAAKVLHYAVVRGTARIVGDAVLGHHCHVFGDARIYGTARVDGHATIGDGADIADRGHVLTVTGLGPDWHTLTAYRARPSRSVDGVWRWTHGLHLSGWFGTHEQLADRVDAGELEDWSRQLLIELDIALDLVRARIDQWESDPIVNADRRRWMLRDSDLRRAEVRATRGGRITPGEQ